MSWLERIGGLLNQYVGGAASPGQVENHYDQVAQQAPPAAIADSLAAAFRSDQTPPFEQMVGQLFGQSNANERAGLLNTLMAAAGPGVLQSALGGGFGNLFGGGQVTPQQASQIPPEAVEQAAAQAAQQNPSIIDQISGFYAQHPTL